MSKLSRAYYDYAGSSLADHIHGHIAGNQVQNDLRYNVGFRLPESILGPDYWKQQQLPATSTVSTHQHGDSNCLGGHNHLAGYKFYDPKGTYFEIPYSTGMGYYDQVDGTDYRKMVPLFNGQKQELKQ
jgi:hypothetical protein